MHWDLFKSQCILCLKSYSNWSDTHLFTQRVQLRKNGKHFRYPPKMLILAVVVRRHSTMIGIREIGGRSMEKLKTLADKDLTLEEMQDIFIRLGRAQHELLEKTRSRQSECTSDENIDMRGNQDVHIRMCRW